MRMPLPRLLRLLLRLLLAHASASVSAIIVILVILLIAGADCYGWRHRASVRHWGRSDGMFSFNGHLLFQRCRNFLRLPEGFPKASRRLRQGARLFPFLLLRSRAGDAHLASGDHGQSILQARRPAMPNPAQQCPIMFMCPFCRTARMHCFKAPIIHR